MKVIKPSPARAASARRKIREADEMLCKAIVLLQEVRDHYNLDLGADSYCDLDLALKFTMKRAAEAHDELQSLLRATQIRLNFKHGRSSV